MHSTVRGADLILSASYSTKPELSQARKIYKGPEIGVDFECGYSMADQVIDENYAVTGEKLVASRRHQGALYFTIDPTADVYIGNRATFTIVPASPGLVNFRAKYCRIAKGAMQHELLGANGVTFCHDVATDFQVDSQYGTSFAQSASYVAFKWNTPSRIHNSEVQKIECTVEFDSAPMDNQGTGAACPLPEVTEEEPDFRSTFVETDGFVDMMVWDF